VNQQVFLPLPGARGQDITVDRSITARAVIHKLADLFIARGIPEHIRSDNRPEFTAAPVRKWLRNLGVRSLYIVPGSPWENGCIESFNSKLRDELLNAEIFTTLFEAKALIETGATNTIVFGLIVLWATGRRLPGRSCPFTILTTRLQACYNDSGALCPTTCLQKCV